MSESQAHRPPPEQSLLPSETLPGYWLSPKPVRKSSVPELEVFHAVIRSALQKNKHRLYWGVLSDCEQLLGHFNKQHELIHGDQRIVGRTAIEKHLRKALAKIFEMMYHCAQVPGGSYELQCRWKEAAWQVEAFRVCLLGDEDEVPQIALSWLERIIDDLMLSLLRSGTSKNVANCTAAIVAIGTGLSWEREGETTSLIHWQPGDVDVGEVQDLYDSLVSLVRSRAWGGGLGEAAVQDIIAALNELAGEITHWDVEMSYLPESGSVMVGLLWVRGLIKWAIHQDEMQTGQSKELGELPPPYNDRKARVTLGSIKAAIGLAAGLAWLFCFLVAFVQVILGVEQQEVETEPESFLDVVRCEVYIALGVMVALACFMIAVRLQSVWRRMRYWA